MPSALRQVVLQPPPNHRIRQADHLPTRPVAIPAMPRIAVEALHRVIHEHAEKFTRRNLGPRFSWSLALLHLRQQFSLLVLGENSEIAPIKKTAAFLYG